MNYFVRPTSFQNKPIKESDQMRKVILAMTLYHLFLLNCNKNVLFLNVDVRHNGVAK